MIENAIDARQFPAWGDFLHNIGWEIERIGATQISIKKLPIFNWSIIKIQHPLNPLPFQEIDAIAKKYHAILVLIEPHLYQYDELSFKHHGYKKTSMHVAPSATLKIDIHKKKEDLFNSFSENAKRNIRKAQKNNISVKIVRLDTKDGEKSFNIFYELLKSLVHMKKFYIPPYSEFLAKMQGFRKNSVLLFAYEKDQPIATVWLGFYKDVSVYLQTGITQRGYELLANYLLVWEALLFSQKKQIKVFDFESIYDGRYPKEHKDWKGYSEFKKRFHGQVVTYPHNWMKVYHPLFKLLPIL